MSSEEHLAERIVRWTDKIPIVILVLLNACLAGFVLLAHGGALVVAYVTHPSTAAETLHVTLPGVILSALIMASSLAAVANTSARRSILLGQAAILCGGALALIGYALIVLMQGLPTSRFTWRPGLMTVFTVYAFYVMRRAVSGKRIAAFWLVNYSHLIALVVVLPIDFVVFLKATFRIP